MSWTKHLIVDRFYIVYISPLESGSLKQRQTFVSSITYRYLQIFRNLCLESTSDIVFGIGQLKYKHSLLQDSCIFKEGKERARTQDLFGTSVVWRHANTYKNTDTYKMFLILKYTQEEPKILYWSVVKRWR